MTIEMGQGLTVVFGENMQFQKKEDL